MNNGKPTTLPRVSVAYVWSGKNGLQLARNTYLYDPDALKFRTHTGWKQDNIWAACLGLTEEAQRLTLLKLADGHTVSPHSRDPVTTGRPITTGAVAA